MKAFLASFQGRVRLRALAPSLLLSLVSMLPGCGRQRVASSPYVYNKWLGYVYVDSGAPISLQIPYFAGSVASGRQWAVRLPATLLSFSIAHNSSHNGTINLQWKLPSYQVKAIHLILLGKGTRPLHLGSWTIDNLRPPTKGFPLRIVSQSSGVTYKFIPKQYAFSVSLSEKVPSDITHIKLNIAGSHRGILVAHQHVNEKGNLINVNAVISLTNRRRLVYIVPALSYRNHLQPFLQPLKPVILSVVPGLVTRQFATKW